MKKNFTSLYFEKFWILFYAPILHLRCGFEKWFPTVSVRLQLFRAKFAWLSVCGLQSGIVEFEPPSTFVAISTFNWSLFILSSLCKD